MALVNCPECGRENISDTAEQCPECGYAVKKHYEREKRLELIEEERKQLEERKQEEIKKLQPELNRKLKEIDSLPYPEKPSVFNSIFGGDSGWLSYVTIIALFFSFLFGFVVVESGLFRVAFVLLLIWTPFWLFLCRDDYKTKESFYQNKISDWEKYKENQKESIKKKYESYADNLAQYGSRERPATLLPRPSEPYYSPQKCPNCGSLKINRISTLNRTVSVATVGLASSKIGKQYECKSCKHKW